MVIHKNSRILTPRSDSISSEERSKEEFTENILRPKVLSEYIGQEQIKKNLEIYIHAAKKRGEPIEHMLFYGPPGLGKTTLANIIAHEMNTNIKTTSGPALEKTGDIAALLSQIQEGDILFIDEIHRLKTPLEELLYTAMEDFALDIMIGKGTGSRSMRINIPPFTLIGATTKYGSLSAPLRDRFGDIAKLSFYSSSEMKQIIMRASQILHIEITDEASEILAKCARATPRIANRLLKRLRDFTEIQGDSCITKTHAEKGMRELGVDALGLDHTDRELLEAIIHTFSGGPVGLSTLAAATAEEKETIEEVYEPYLLQIGFLQRSPRGRIATEKAYNHLGILYNTQQNSLF